MKRTLLVLLVALAGLPACKDTMGPTGGPLTGLAVSPSPLYLGVGDTMTLSAIGTRDDGTTAPATATFKSSNTSIVTVSGSGLARGVAVGTATITAKSGGKSSVVTVNVLSSAGGAIRTFNVNDANCDNPVYHGARLVATSTHALIYEDITNPTGGFTAAEYQGIINELEGTVYPTDVANFGTPTDIDGNGHFIVLYTRAVNDLTPVGAGFVYGGFFHPRDMFPRTPNTELDGCLGSNVTEMFYMLAPDPSGVSNGHVRTKAYVRGNTVGTIAHEFQHLINTSRRIHVNHADSLFEKVWLDEALAHVAEELNFYTASGLAPRQNLGQPEVLANQTRVDAFNQFQLENFGRFDEYLRAPAVNAPYANDDDLATRGAGWAFLRYMADRRGGSEQSFWFAVVNSNINGLENLQAVLGADPVLWARDWAVANYTDEAVPVTALFTHPSWKFRDLYTNAAFGGFHLQVQALAAGNTSNTIQAGSAAYYKFGVAVAQTADVRLAPTGSTVAGACTPVALAVGGVQQLTLGAGQALCFPGGGDYALIPFHASNTLGQTFAVTITATNVIAAIPPPSPVRASTAPLFALDSYSIMHPWDGGMETRMRERAYAELRHKVHRAQGGGGLRADLSNVVGSILYVNVVRIR